MDTRSSIFFFQAEDGIRDVAVTGVQTCALPISYREDSVKAVDALTRHLQEAMEAEVVNVERIDDARLLQSIEALYRDVLARAVMEARGVGPRDVDLVRLSR